MSYREEFPHFPGDSIPLGIFVNGWTDRSYRNDVCPSFEHGEFTLFVDFPDASKREYEDAPRYRCYHANGEKDESDHWMDIVEFVRFWAHGVL